jgi:hypothetical protein
MGKQFDYEAEWERRLRAVGVGIAHISRLTSVDDNTARRLTEVRFKLDADSGTSVLAIVKAVEPAGRIIAFCGGPTLTDTVISLGKKLAADALRWREDIPWGE